MKQVFQSGKSQKPSVNLPVSKDIFFSEAKLEYIPVGSS